jgi:hypothetical protein
MNNALTNVSVRQLKRAIKIKLKLEALQTQFDEIIGSGGEVPAPFRKRRMSAAGRAAIAAAARRRWAKVKSKAGKPVKRGKRKMSAAARAKMSAVAKARWQKAKAAGKTTL